MAVLWADVSYYQPVVTDAYPHPVLAIRSNDGTYRDPKFAANYAWARRAMDSGKLAALIVYCVYRPNWEQTAATMMDMVGKPAHPQVVAMIDVESWGGQIHGDHSAAINQLHQRLADWLGDPRRVIGYGNQGDLNSLWLSKPPGIQLVVASYGSVPTYADMIAHQYGDNVACDPFGPCDANSSNAHTLETLLTTLGLRERNREVRHTMERLPLTPTPNDPNSDPRGWLQRNWDVSVDIAGGWEGDCAMSFGGQDWPGRTVNDVRAFLHIASWMMDDGTLHPVQEGDQTPYVKGQGRTVEAHKKLGPWLAPRGAVGITLNYAAPGEGRVSVGRSA
jgi:hypothetical protein